MVHGTVPQKCAQTHDQNTVKVFRTARYLENCALASRRLHQCAPKRRHPTDAVAVEIDPVA